MEKEKLLEKIKKLIQDNFEFEDWKNDKGNYPTTAFGIRIPREDVSVGDYLPCSYDLSIDGWEDMTKNELEPYKLKGTSAVKINHKFFKDDPENEISRVIDLVKEYGLIDDAIIIMGIDWGNVDASDGGEVLIKDAEVIGKIK